MPYKERKKKATRFIRGSPERERGLKDAVTSSSKVKEYSFAEAIAYVIKYELGKAIYLSLLFGFTIWWTFLSTRAGPQGTMGLYGS